MGRPPICNCCGITTVFPTTTTIIPPTTPPPEYSCYVCLDGVAGTSCLDNLTQEQCENIGGYWLPFACGNSQPSFDLCPPPDCDNFSPNAQEDIWEIAEEHNGSWVIGRRGPIFGSNFDINKSCLPPDGELSGGTVYANVNLSEGALYFQVKLTGITTSRSRVEIRNSSTGERIYGRLFDCIGVRCPCIDCGDGPEYGGGSASCCHSDIAIIPEDGCYQIVFTVSSDASFSGSLKIDRGNIRPACDSDRVVGDCQTCDPSTTTTTTGSPTTTTTGGPTTTTGGPTTSTTPCPYSKICTYEWNGSSWIKTSSTLNGVDFDCIETGSGGVATCPEYCDSCSCTQPNTPPGEFETNCITIEYSCCDCSIVNVETECPPTTTTTTGEPTTSEPTTSSPTSGPSGPTPDPLGPS